MMLAKDKFGRIGRQIKSCGLEAVTEPAMRGDRRGSLIVSARSIEEDDIYFKNEEAKARANEEAKILQAKADQIKEKEMMRRKALEMKAFQAQASYYSKKENEKLVKYFTQQLGSTETDRVAQSVQADFSETEMVESGGTMRPIVRRADFDMMKLVGNPLTRNGQFGPVTDYDLLVSGNELDNDRIVGGTMLGRYNGSTVGYRGPQSQMGSFWEDLSNKFQSEVIDKAVPAAIENEIKKQIAYTAPSAPVVPVVVNHPVVQAGTVSTYSPSGVAKSLGVPVWAVYGAGGLLALGVGLVAYKALKK